MGEIGIRYYAMKLWLPLAQQGNVEAQYRVGQMYYLGLGMPQEDEAKAKDWLEKAAAQGDAKAQSILGAIYEVEVDQGVRQDYVQAYMWYSLAVSSDDEDIRKVAILELGAFTRKMTPEQIAEGKRLVSEWKSDSKPGHIRQ